MRFIKYGQWGEARELLKGAPAALRDAMRTAARQEAELLRTKIVQKIGRGPFKPLSPYTLAVYKFLGKKHGGKPLIHNGDLLGGVRVAANQAGYYVGIPRAARNREGESLVRLADIHEKGRTIVLATTPKMLAFLHAAFRAAGLPPKPTAPNAKGTGIIVIRIPARPFIGPATEEWEKGHEQRFAGRLAKLTKGRYGTFP